MSLLELLSSDCLLGFHPCLPHSLLEPTSLPSPLPGASMHPWMPGSFPGRQHSHDHDSQAKESKVVASDGPPVCSQVWYCQTPTYSLSLILSVTVFCQTFRAPEVSILTFIFSRPPWSVLRALFHLLRHGLLVPQGSLSSPAHLWCTEQKPSGTETEGRCTSVATRTRVWR